MIAPRPVSIVLVGRDSELWLTAVALAHALTPAGVSITAVELPSLLARSDIHATLPQLEALHDRLGVAPRELFRAGGAGISLGQNFVNATARPSAFFHAWGACGQPIDGHDFLHCWLRAGAEGLSVGLQGFSLCAAAALNGRVPLDDAAAEEAFGRPARGLHLHAIGYAAYLKSLAVRRGITVRQTTHLEAERDESGAIAAVRVDGVERITGDLFVDASGEDAVLIAGALQCPRRPWPERFGADRVLEALAPAFTATPPFAEVRIGASGWTALHPTPSATGIVHAFRGALAADTQAAEAAATAAGAPLAHVRVRPLESGVRRELWSGNCVAVGRAAARFDPLHDVDLHVLQLGIVHLISLFPAGDTQAAERAEYNRAMHSHFERLREFQCAFYALASRPGPFWQDNRRLNTGTLAHTVATFRAGAYVPPHEDETFPPDSWHACLLGLGVRPERWPPATDRIPARRLRARIERLLELIRATVLRQPTHDAYLRGLEPARVPNRTPA